MLNCRLFYFVFWDVQLATNCSGRLYDSHHFWAVAGYLNRSIKKWVSASCIFWYVDQETFEIFKTTNKKYLKYLNQSIKRWVSASCIFWHVDQEIFEIRVWPNQKKYWTLETFETLDKNLGHCKLHFLAYWSINIYWKKNQEIFEIYYLISKKNIWDTWTWTIKNWVSASCISSGMLIKKARRINETE